MFQCFCIHTVLSPFQLTHSNDVSLRFPVIQVDGRDNNFETVLVDTARIFVDGCTAVVLKN